MKNIIILLVVVLFGCVPPAMVIEDVYQPGKPPPKVTTFSDVSQPYLTQYGEPEDSNEFNLDGYSKIDWWWWTQGFTVAFVTSPYDDVDGWKVESTFSFQPIKRLDKITNKQYN